MASIIYNSALEDAVIGNIDFNTDSFKIILVTSSYAADKDAHTKRSDVTNEVTGTGYTTGGVSTAVTVTKDTANDRVDIDFADVSWANATITAAGAVIYKTTGSAAADNLVAFMDFGSDITSTNGTFTVDVTSPLRIQN
jgi:hypothetical protein